MNSADSIGTAYRALALKAWRTNQCRAAELTSIVEEWRRSETLPADQQQRGKAVAHSLRGSAGTFGHVRASRAAEELEQLLSAPREGPPPGEVAELMDTVERSLAEEPELDL